MDGFLTFGPWTWLVIGMVLIALEAMLPGIFFIWLGIAALLTGVIDWAFGWSWQVNLVVFAMLALLACLTGWLITRRKDEDYANGATLNRRSVALVGREFLLDRAIISGQGRIRVGDSVWGVTGPELPAGAKVRVTQADGARLTVEPAE
ncbi:NfeD family protein [Enterovirga rhinocerotis]|uniref:NfeD-like C-terminal domain-containing protein n=1 Tax=Enterovirga rhinocerotis TaxID=1339210 RepID=A0A4R7C9E5_9HYPH|nr:NfeD family protein [Enterovirga rhinocerotis]TDR93965.1 hypothetical protein EV668_1234 [Enterovirga rhinocerotis]